MFLFCSLDWLAEIETVESACKLHVRITVAGQHWGHSAVIVNPCNLVLINTQHFHWHSLIFSQQQYID